MDVMDRNPENILKKIEQDQEKEQKGRLKIFFGYAAGVGKTYSMLKHAGRELRDGADIVAGYIEPHARPETARLLEGLEMIPPRAMQMNRIACNELDIDAVLQRRPEIVLIDEMAHTNADGCRHLKRYQDIEEILNAGIDVYTTVNVQHIESVHDTVAGITGVTVRERIPDAAFDRASRIEMTDIPPEELIARLQAGKIYQKDSAQRALGNFFTVQNLTALREIALRRMADWVNSEQEHYMAAEKKGNAAEHVMMCLSPSPSNAKVIRQAARMAKAFHGRLTAFYVETSEDAQMDGEDSRRLQENRKLAEKFGAKVVVSNGNNIVEQIARYAQIARVTKIVLGRSYTKHTVFSAKENMADGLARLVPNLEIFLIPDLYEKKYRKKRKGRAVKIERRSVINDIFICAAVLSGTTLLAFLFERLGFSESNLVMLYVLGAMIAALLARHLAGGIMYGVMAILAFNFLFTQPRLTLDVYEQKEYVITFAVMFAITVIISALTRKIKGVAKQNAEKAYRMRVLLDTSQLLQQARSAEEIARRTAGQLGKLLGCNICCFIGSPEENKSPVTYCPDRKEYRLSEQERAVAEWSYKNNKSAGATTSTLPGAQNLFLTIRNGEKIFGLVGIGLGGRPLAAFEESLMLALLNESALAFEKEEGIRKEKEMAVRLEQEQLRVNLLRSISHDLRTPLTSIYGNADILLSQGENMSPQQKREIYSDTYEDAAWLMNLVENLLSVTRIENGTIKLNIQPELMDDVIAESLKHVNKRASGHKIHYEAPEELLLAPMDSKLIMQVIMNLVDNAVKYTPKGSRIDVAAFRRKDCVSVEVKDNGRGIADAQKEKVFELFYTGKASAADSRRGMGLGLALCKSIVKAHGGRIWVRDNEDGAGAVFGFELKLEGGRKHEQ